MNTATGPAIIDDAADATTPTLRPDRAQVGLGIGSGGSADRLGLIADGNEIISVRPAVVSVNQNVSVTNSSNLLVLDGYLELTEIAAPGAPAGDKVRVYAVVGGGSLTDLAAVFQDGTVDIFAQEV